MNPELKADYKAALFMTNRLEIPAARRLACSGCGAEFACNPAGPCWCADESFRLPMPSDGGDCLCPDCLRKMAGALATAFPAN
jgi:hypothetical protein